MNIDLVIQKALSLKLEINGKSTGEIIRMIQVAEGFSPCYGSKKVCINQNCCWRSTCSRMGIHYYNVV